MPKCLNIFCTRRFLMPNVVTVYCILIIRHLIKTIGAPAAVEIKYKGKPVDLNQFIQTNKVALLTIDLSSKMISISKKVI